MRSNTDVDSPASNQSEILVDENEKVLFQCETNLNNSNVHSDDDLRICVRINDTYNVNLSESFSIDISMAEYICSTINGTDYTCSTKHIRIRKFLHLKVINNFSLPSTDESCVGYVPNGSIIYCVDGSPHQCHDNSNTLPNSLRQYFVMQGIIIISLYNHNDIIIVATTVTDIMAPAATSHSFIIRESLCRDGADIHTKSLHTL